MRTIIGLLFCVLLGVMVKAQGIIALFWFPLGFIIGLFVTAQIVLPIVLGLPRAIRLVSRGAMRSAVYLRLIVTPFVWLLLLAVIFFLVGLFWPSAVAWLDVFWSNHNPTTLNRQGPDVGTQYRSVIFYHSPEQKQQAEASRAALEKSGR